MPGRLTAEETQWVFSHLCVVARWGLEGGLVQGPTIPLPYTFTPLLPWQYAAPWLPAEPGSLQGWRSAALAGKEMPGGINCTCPTHWHKQFEWVQGFVGLCWQPDLQTVLQKGKTSADQTKWWIKERGKKITRHSPVCPDTDTKTFDLFMSTRSSHPAESASFTRAPP